jgi:hypothetical protein
MTLSIGLYRPNGKFRSGLAFRGKPNIGVSKSIKLSARLFMFKIFKLKDLMTLRAHSILKGSCI